MFVIKLLLKDIVGGSAIQRLHLKNII